jgi:hypothetical protein
VTYRAEFEGGALVQLNGLPRAAFDALVERVAVLVREPWDAQLITPGADPAYRQAVFGVGWGLLSFRVDEAAELIRIFRHRLDRLTTYPLTPGNDAARDSSA